MARMQNGILKRENFVVCFLQICTNTRLVCKSDKKQSIPSEIVLIVRGVSSS